MPDESKRCSNCGVIHEVHVTQIMIADEMYRALKNLLLVTNGLTSDDPRRLEAARWDANMALLWADKGHA